VVVIALCTDNNEAQIPSNEIVNGESWITEETIGATQKHKHKDGAENQTTCDDSHI
jgi:hypothetical protein